MGHQNHTRFMQVSIHRIMSFLLLMAVGLAIADESEDPGPPPDTFAYDQVIVRFNSNTTSFATWDDFKAAIFNNVELGVTGRCYKLTGSSMNPVEITKVQLQRMPEEGWSKTRGNGWRRTNKDRTFVEYRLNETARVLIRSEGVKPRFFFAYTKRICEFPFRSGREQNKDKAELAPLDIRVSRIDA